MPAYITNVIFALAFITSLSGCTIVPTKSDHETNYAINMDVSQDKSLIYVVRPSAYYMGGRHFNVFINDKHIGPIGSSHFYVIETPPGKYFLTHFLEDHIITNTVKYVSGSVVVSEAYNLETAAFSDKKGVIVEAVAGNKHYVELAIMGLEAKMRQVDSTIFNKGTFSSPSLVEIIRLSN